MAYGLAGPYEKLTGMVHFEVDPANPANRIVTDIEFAPRNDRGMVEFRSNFFLLKPKDAGRGNGTVLYEVSNRGGKGMLGYFNNAAGSRDPRTAEEMGRRVPARERLPRCCGSAGSSTCRCEKDRCGCTRRWRPTTATRSRGLVPQRGDRQPARLRPLASPTAATSPTRSPTRTTRPT